jgi:putative transposase
LKDFVDKHRDTYGVEPICKVLQIAPSGYRRHAACQRKPELRCARAKTDDTLMPQIQQVWQSNMQVYGADKVWHQMNREGYQGSTLHRRAADETFGVAGCTPWQGHTHHGP